MKMSKEEYVDFSPNVFIGFSELSSEEYEYERRRHASFDNHDKNNNVLGKKRLPNDSSSKKKKNQTRTITKPKNKNKNKNQILSLNKCNTKKVILKPLNQNNLLKLEDFYMNNSSLLLNLDIPIKIKPEVIKEKKKEEFLTKMKGYLTDYVKSDHNLQYITTNADLFSSLLIFIKSNMGINNVITHDLFNDYLRENPSINLSPQKLKQKYDIYLSAFDYYKTIKEEDAIKEPRSIDEIKALMSDHNKTATLINMITRYDSDANLNLKTMMKDNKINEPFIYKRNDFDVIVSSIHEYLKSIENSREQNILLKDLNKITQEQKTVRISFPNYTKLSGYYSNYPLAFSINNENDSFYNKANILNRLLPSILQFKSNENLLSLSTSYTPKVKVIYNKAKYPKNPRMNTFRRVMINLSNENITHFIIPASYNTTFIENSLSLSSNNQPIVITIDFLEKHLIPYYSFIQRPNEILHIPIKCIHSFQCFNKSIEPTITINYDLVFPEDITSVFESWSHFHELKLKFPIEFLSILLSYINDNLFKMPLIEVRNCFTKLNQLHHNDNTALQDIYDIFQGKPSLLLTSTCKNDAIFCEECYIEFFNYSIKVTVRTLGPSFPNKLNLCPKCFLKRLNNSNDNESATLYYQFLYNDIRILLTRMNYRIVNNDNITKESFERNKGLYVQYEESLKSQEAFNITNTGKDGGLSHKNDDLEYVYFDKTIAPCKETSETGMDMISRNLIPLIDAELFFNKKSPLSLENEDHYIEYDTYLYQNNVVIFSPDPYKEKLIEMKPEIKSSHGSSALRSLIAPIEPVKELEAIQIDDDDNDGNAYADNESSMSNQNNKKPTKKFIGKSICDFLPKYSHEDNYEDHAHRALHNMTSIDRLILQDNNKKKENAKKDLDKGISILSSPFLNYDSLNQAISFIVSSFTYPELIKQYNLVSFLKNLLLNPALEDDIKSLIRSELIDPLNNPFYWI